MKHAQGRTRRDKSGQTGDLVEASGAALDTPVHAGNRAKSFPVDHLGNPLDPYHRECLYLLGLAADRIMADKKAK